MKKQKIKVYDHEFCRIDIWLHRNFPDFSRSAFIRLIKQGFIQKNQVKVLKPSTEIRPGDILEINWPTDAIQTLEPQNLPLDIIYHDDHILVVNKRAGMIVHPVRPFQKNTLINSLLFHGIQLSRYGFPLRPGIVHRLDRDTSGVLVIAKTDRAYLELIQQFKNRTIEKYYLALIEGQWQGIKEIDFAITRNPREPCRMKISSSSGKPARTEIEPLWIGDNYSLLFVKPRTGRTHQIRVHLSSQGYPIVGDKSYGSQHSESIIQRQALHAFIISFPHPITRKKMIFAAALPSDFQEALKRVSYPANLFGKDGSHG
ncbi:MAG: RluA family pseudouridine synthase [Candidatus Atribacteria bacterium]|nr:RluA family pseudouridine synthase [Candidatus Atribacteria bacterium]